MVIVWDLQQNSIEKKLSMIGASISSVCFSPDRKYIAVSNIKGTIKVWKVIGESDYQLVLNTIVDQPQYHPNYPIAFSPDSSILAVGGAERNCHLWDLSKDYFRSIVKDPASANPRALFFAPDGMSLMAVCEDNQISIWDIKDVNNSLLVKSPSLPAACWGFTSAAVSPDGKWIGRTYFSPVLGLSPLASPENGKQLDGLEGALFYPIYTAVSFSYDSQLLFAARGDGRDIVDCWEVATANKVGHLIVRRYQTDNRFIVACSPTSPEFATGGSDGAIQLWNIASINRYGDSESRFHPEKMVYA